MDWQLLIYFVVNILVILGVVWKGGQRLGKIETSIEWLRDGFKDLKIDLDNVRTQAFRTHSPVALTDKGKGLLNNSGIREYVNENKETLLAKCKGNKNLKTAYDVQEFVFALFENLEFDEKTDKKIKNYAYKEGVSTDIIRRVGAIYFRDLAIENCGFKLEDLDNGKE